jgi:hypothetical protein
MSTFYSLTVCQGVLYLCNDFFAAVIVYRDRVPQTLGVRDGGPFRRKWSTTFSSTNLHLDQV